MDERLNRSVIDNIIQDRINRIKLQKKWGI